MCSFQSISQTDRPVLCTQLLLHHNRRVIWIFLQMTGLRVLLEVYCEMTLWEYSIFGGPVLQTIISAPSTENCWSVCYAVINPRWLWRYPAGIYGDSHITEQADLYEKLLRNKKNPSSSKCCLSRFAEPGDRLQEDKVHVKVHDWGWRHGAVGWRLTTDRSHYPAGADLFLPSSLHLISRCLHVCFHLCLAVLPGHWWSWVCYWGSICCISVCLYVVL